MSDYRVTIRVRNARILRAMEAAGFETIAELSRSCGVHQGELGRLVNLTKIPTSTRTGGWSAAVEKLSFALKVPAEQLFSRAQLTVSSASKVRHKDVSERDVHAFIASASMSSPLLEDQVESDDAMRKALAQVSLTQREKQVLMGRFVEDKTLQEVADWLGIGRERIRQIEEARA